MTPQRRRYEAEGGKVKALRNDPQPLRQDQPRSLQPIRLSMRHCHDPVKQPVAKPQHDPEPLWMRYAVSLGRRGVTMFDQNQRPAESRAQGDQVRQLRPGDREVNDNDLRLEFLAKRYPAVHHLTDVTVMPLEGRQLSFEHAIDPAERRIVDQV